MIHHYRPQRSWAKVMFLQASVILSTGGVCLSACWDTTPPDRTKPSWARPLPRADTPSTRHPPPGPDQTLRDQTTPPEQTPPWDWTRPPWARPHPLPDQIPPEQTLPPDQTPPGRQTSGYGQWAAGTHPTGMHSCWNFILQSLVTLIYQNIRE